MTKFGELIEGDMPPRDAIHVAAAPVTASETLSPGEHITFIQADCELVGRSKVAAIGIVDPFLQAPVKKGQRFWMFLYPNTVTTLTHQWEHPAFEKRMELMGRIKHGDSEDWLRRYANEQLDTGYNALISGTRSYLKYDEYMVEGGKFEGIDLDPEFWYHYQRVTGEVVPTDKQHSFFGCSC